jgi:hypothetical protein
MRGDDPRWKDTHCKCGQWVFEGEHTWKEQMKDKIEELERRLANARCLYSMMEEKDEA